MSNESTEAKGIRLPASLWEMVDAEARKLRMSRSEYVQRLLASSVDWEPKMQKSDANTTKSHTNRMVEAI
jgi:metal-responsive CopG/Arc/MetJ family transcriptional regulator